MTILSAQSIRRRVSNWCEYRFASTVRPGLCIKPFEAEAKKEYGMSYGLSSCGYDIRLGRIGRGDKVRLDSYKMDPGEFLLCSSLEYFELPHDLCARVLDKSTWARQGLALQNTICEPGWRGHITLELSNHSNSSIRIHLGQPIAQVLFEMLDAPTELPYKGKYQDQGDEVVSAKFTHT